MADMLLQVPLALIVFVLLLAIPAMMRGAALSRRILTGLVLGVLFGLALQWLLSPAAIEGVLRWTGVIADAYVALLRMIIVPLVLVMIIAAVVRAGELARLGKQGGAIIAVLLGTTAIAALVGTGIALAFDLDAQGLVSGVRESARAAELDDSYASFGGGGFAELLTALFPTNIVQDLGEARATSIIAVVIVAALVGIAALQVGRDDPMRAAQIEKAVSLAQAVVLRLVRMVIALTPFGILALIAGVVASASAADIVQLGAFLAASYIAIAIMFAVHAALIFAIGGRNPLRFFADAWPVLVFAFTSRSSAATIPLNVETQIDRLRVPPAIANLSASFGATIGQNGCAGIYPAMLAVMTAPMMGVDPTTVPFVAGLVAIVVIGSFGVAGVGGGATMAAFIVLPALGFPVTVAALLISIEPLIDMARTALNVNGSMTAGVLTARWFGDAAGDAGIDGTAG